MEDVYPNRSSDVRDFAVYPEASNNRAAELGRRVGNAAARILQRGRIAVHEHPAEVVLAAGLAGLVAGIVLRLGRSRRAQ